jgi:fido (protein-threonine AMPylation protein)
VHFCTFAPGIAIVSIRALPAGRSHRKTSASYTNDGWEASTRGGRRVSAGQCVSKAGFMFAAAAQVLRLMAEFEARCLSRFTPLNNACGDIPLALAETHTELLLIHPFRGNGRIARLLAKQMSLQAAIEIAEFESLVRRRREEYFAAVRAGQGHAFHSGEGSTITRPSPDDTRAASMSSSTATASSGFTGGGAPSRSQGTASS